MAPEKQTIANQHKAVRHGLAAETVIDSLEDAADYNAFERVIKSDYSPQTAIEGQLVSRLASQDAFEEAVADIDRVT